MWSHRTRQPFFFSGTCGFSQRPSLLFPLSFSGLQICSVAWESVCWSQINKHIQCYWNKPDIDATILLLGDEEGTRIRKSSVYFSVVVLSVSFAISLFHINNLHLIYTAIQNFGVSKIVCKDARLKWIKSYYIFTMHVIKYLYFR